MEKRIFFNLSLLPLSFLIVSLKPNIALVQKCTQSLQHEAKPRETILLGGNPESRFYESGDSVL
ncbi:hypothetical protein MTR_1g021027 [Medicago truncatula]|uniref:Transmembrane protein n=1 Tax=Medicago truncatula TaxID=3880 RepID=A0A072VPJ0_MEDTR|nr:hypothetical protein MTR_1g021027 [Medicago truncatula]